MGTGNKKQRPHSSKRRVIKTIFVTLAVLILALVAYMLIEAKVVHLSYADVQLRDLPSEFEGVKLLFVSDLHIDFLNSPGAVYRLMQQLDELKPDLLLLGGDYTSYGLDNQLKQFLHIGNRGALQKRETARRDQFFLMLKNIQPPLGKFAVQGNHDNWTDGLEASLALGDVRLLVNDSAIVTKDGARLVIAGLDDWSTGIRRVDAVAKRVNASDCVILLSHSPDALPIVSNQPASDGGQWADLMLSGHTHGGQIRPFGKTVGLPSAYGDRYLSGWVSESGTELLVSNGVGTSVAPLRWNAPAQAHLITLHCAP